MRKHQSPLLNLNNYASFRLVNEYLQSVFNSAIHKRTFCEQYLILVVDDAAMPVVSQFTKLFNLIDFGVF